VKSEYAVTIEEHPDSDPQKMRAKIRAVLEEHMGPEIILYVNHRWSLPSAEEVWRANHASETGYDP
jgi:hypothetical protein